MAETAMRLDDEDVRLIRLLAEGVQVETAARKLCVSERTLRRRIRALCDRFEVDAPVKIVVWAVRNGVL